MGEFYKYIYFYRFAALILEIWADHPLGSIAFYKTAFKLGSGLDALATKIFVQRRFFD